jgi:hypothetical protein
MCVVVSPVRTACCIITTIIIMIILVVILMIVGIAGWARDRALIDAGGQAPAA